MVTRCAWVTDEPLYMVYHDEEWGVPQHDDRHLFEMLVLEGMQAGLSWWTVLKRRAHFKAVFDDFHPEKVAAYDAAKIDALLADPGIIRHRGKVEAAVNNARQALRVRDEFGSLDAYLWGFVDGKPVVNHWPTLADVPAQTETSQAMSKALKQRGFTFVGPTICYAYMQACGMVNDHTTDCFRHAPLA